VLAGGFQAGWGEMTASDLVAPRKSKELIMQPCDHCGYNIDIPYRIPDKPDRVCSDCYREYMERDMEHAVCEAEYKYDYLGEDR